MRVLPRAGLWMFVLGALCCDLSAVALGKSPSHPPTRPLPVPSKRPKSDGPAYYADSRRGHDGNAGSKSKPWKTITYAVSQLKPGDTLYLRGGTYYEHITVEASGAPDKPITIRSCPGELAILDGGLREFFERPDKAWEPCPGGLKGEFWSKKTYPGLHGESVRGPHLMGRFGDSMVPLHGYHYRADLQFDSPFWSGLPEVAKAKKSNLTDGSTLYCGPGIWYDTETGRIHIRLAHTDWKFLSPEDRYRGETDPRKLRLVISGHAEISPLALLKVKHVQLQDLVIRGSGARSPALKISDSEDVELDGVTVYGGRSAVAIDHAKRLRFLNSACRGVSAPWTFRGFLKYRSVEARLFSASSWTPNGNSDFELAYSEFTDSVDGVFIGNVAGVEFHHNHVDNISDDGIFLTATTDLDGNTPGGNIRIYQNLLSRCLSTFAFGVGHGHQKAIEGGKQLGAGVWICRNIFDFRKWVPYQLPAGPEAPQEITTYGRLWGNHASPVWEPMYFSHNTVVSYDAPWRDYYAAGLGGFLRGGTKRRVFNNIFLHVNGRPGATFSEEVTDFQADGNLNWSVSDGPTFTGDFLAKFRSSKLFDESKTRYPPGWAANDLFANPNFLRFSGNWKHSFDLRLRQGSPAINSGVAVPAEWPDPLRASDKGQPDIGALPPGVKPWGVGVEGRYSMFGSSDTFR